MNDPTLTEMNVEISSIEGAIICGAVEDADTWGMGRIILAKQRIEEAGFVWTDKHELFLFEEFVDD